MSDENINVRLAAVDALSNYTNSELTRTAFIEAIKYHEFPELQIAIIRILGHFKDQRVIPSIKNLIENENVPLYVKDQAQLQFKNIL